MNDDEFEEFVRQGMDTIPKHFISKMKNVAIVIADDQRERN